MFVQIYKNLSYHPQSILFMWRFLNGTLLLTVLYTGK